MTGRGKHKKHLVVGGLIVLAGFVGVRLLSKLVSSADEATSVDDNAPRRLRMYQHERTLPPFFNPEMPSIIAEGERDGGGYQQFIILGIDQGECDAALKHADALFAIARADASGMWHPAVAKTTLHYGAARDADGEVYAVALPVGMGALRVAAGVMRGVDFTPFKHIRQLALTNHDGLLYDYPNVPVVHIVE